MAGDKGKKAAAPSPQPGSDPSVLSNNYIRACKHIGIEPSKSLVASLNDENNPDRGTVVPPSYKIYQAILPITSLALLYFLPIQARKSLL
jgi:hypothetical protein